MDNPLCIVGIGAYTPIGLNAPAAVAAARAGITNFKEHPYMIDRNGDPYILAMVPTLNTGIKETDRYLHLALPAMTEALSPLTKPGKRAGKIHIQIGLPETRPGFPEDLPVRLVNSVNTLDSENYLMGETETIAKGHAAGLMALEAAGRLITNRSCDFCLAGGVESYINPDTLDWLEENEQVHMPSNAWGFIPGEAASFCLLCSQDTAEKYNLPIRARLVSISTAFEKNIIKTETVCIGRGLTLAVKNCIEQLPAGTRIDYTICDQNGEAYRADEFGFMLARLSDHFIAPPDYMAPADCWGDVGAASGPLFTNLAIFSAEKGYAKGTRTLLWTSSEGGERTAAIIEADIKERGAA